MNVPLVIGIIAAVVAFAPDSRDDTKTPLDPIETPSRGVARPTTRRSPVRWPAVRAGARARTTRSAARGHTSGQGRRARAARRAWHRQDGPRGGRGRAAHDFLVLRTIGGEAEMELPFAAAQQLCTPGLADLDQLPGPQRDARLRRPARQRGPLERSRGAPRHGHGRVPPLCRLPGDRACPPALRCSRRLLVRSGPYLARPRRPAPRTSNAQPCGVCAELGGRRLAPQRDLSPCRHL